MFLCHCRPLFFHDWCSGKNIDMNQSSGPAAAIAAICPVFAGELFPCPAEKEACFPTDPGNARNRRRLRPKEETAFQPPSCAQRDWKNSLIFTLFMTIFVAFRMLMWYYNNSFIHIYGIIVHIKEVRKEEAAGRTRSHSQRRERKRSIWDEERKIVI